MSTYREIVYLVLDKLKGMSDDFSFTEDHILFLANKYRAFLLNQKYSEKKTKVHESNYQLVHLEMEAVNNNCNETCTQGGYLRSTTTIPFPMNIALPRVYDCNYMVENIAYISKDRMRFVGYNKYLNSTIYCSIYPDKHLYMKSNDEVISTINKVEVFAVFPDALEMLPLITESNCDPLDNTFPLEDVLIEPLVELIIKDILSDIYRPKDETNNATDDLADMMAFVRRNMKSALQKQLEQ